MSFLFLNSNVSAKKYLPPFTCFPGSYPKPMTRFLLFLYSLNIHLNSYFYQTNNFLPDDDAYDDDDDDDDDDTTIKVLQCP